MPQPPDLEGQTADLHIAFPANPAAIRDTLVHILAVPPLSRLSTEARGNAELVLAEVLNNVAEHAYPERAGPVAISLRRVDDGICCHIVDRGAAMPGNRLPEGELPDRRDLALDELPEGGFGWHLIRRLTCDLIYARRDKENRLSFRLPDDG